MSAIIASRYRPIGQRKVQFAANNSVRNFRRINESYEYQYYDSTLPMKLFDGSMEASDNSTAQQQLDDRTRSSMDWESTFDDLQVEDEDCCMDLSAYMARLKGLPQPIKKQVAPIVLPRIEPVVLPVSTHKDVKDNKEIEVNEEDFCMDFSAYFKKESPATKKDDEAARIESIRKKLKDLKEGPSPSLEIPRDIPTIEELRKKLVALKEGYLTPIPSSLEVVQVEEVEEPAIDKKKTKKASGIRAILDRLFGKSEKRTSSDTTPMAPPSIVIAPSIPSTSSIGTKEHKVQFSATNTVRMYSIIESPDSHGIEYEEPMATGNEVKEPLQKRHRKKREARNAGASKVSVPIIHSNRTKPIEPKKLQEEEEEAIAGEPSVSRNKGSSNNPFMRMWNRWQTSWR